MSNTLARPLLFKPPVPQIDWNKRITNKLVCDVPFFENTGGATRDIVNKVPFTATGSPTPGVGWWGRGVTYNGTTQYHASSAPISTVVDNWTMMIVFRFIATTAGDGGEQLIFYNGTDSGGYGIGLNGRNCEYLFGGHARIPTGAAGDLDNNGNDAAVLVLRRLAGTSDIWRDGVDLNATTATTPGTPVTKTSLGMEDNGSGTASRFANVMLQVARFWERPLEATEIRKISLNPSMIYQYPKPILTNSVSAGVVVRGSFFPFFN